MPRVTHVKSARKDNPVCKKGESYYWWKFRYGGKRYSLTRPRQSQLTQSAYFGTVYSTQEMIEDWTGEADDWEGLVDEVRDAVTELRDETQDSLDNMPEQLQYSPTGELLQERVDALDSVESELDCIDEFDFDEEEFEPEEFDDSDYEDDEEREADEADHNSEQEQAQAEHEAAEETRKEEEFRSWFEDAKSQLTEALDQAII